MVQITLLGKSDLSPNPWDRVKVKKGKLTGMLTDELANNTIPKTGGDGTSTKLTTVGNLGKSKAYKRPLPRLR